jgi:NAD(P)-dependent dehydrogenase (short-subunit alcohol dehydrogenase family)
VRDAASQTLRGTVLIVKQLATSEDWDKIFAINVRGVFLTYKYAAQKMVALNETHKRGRRIIGASSLLGKRGSTPSTPSSPLRIIFFTQVKNA